MLNMHYIDSISSIFVVFCYQSTMTVFGSILSAQQADVMVSMATKIRKAGLALL